MPEDVLLELETAAHGAGNLESIEDRVRVIARDLSLAIEGMKGSASRWENAWRRMIIRDVATGQTMAVQAIRPRLLNAFEKLLGQLKETHELARWLHKPGTADVPGPDVLLPEIVAMERLKAQVFDQWQSAEDLEDLAARDYPLTTADLDKIGPHYKPPMSWYADESKPF
jgi:hypothetical protein